MKTLYATVLLFLLPLLGKAQLDYWQGGVFVGLSAYSGDVNPTASPDLSEASLSFGMVGQAYISSKLGFRGSLIYANLTGDDRNYVQRADRNFRFNTNVFELSMVAEWEPFGSNRYFADARGKVVMDRLVSPYLFTGIAVGLATLDTDFSDYDGNSQTIINGIREDRTIGNSTTFFSIPIGAGVKFDITQKITLALEGSGRISFSDYLDGISAAAGTGNDLYFTGGLIAYYRFTQ